MLVNSIFNFPPLMVFFTTPELLEIGGLPLVTPYDKPTRLEALRYYRRVVDTFGLQMSFHEEVCEIEREERRNVSPSPRKSRGGTRVRQARAVVLAIGYYDLPNYLGRSRRGSAARLALLHRRASRTTGSASSSSAERTRRRRRRWSCFAPART